ncbi:MAG: DUF1385 domain-containing protein [Syntrophobacterales bacterium]|nr:DUF1385 domain-containing protein [Syntrophobacterales bacterium]
MVAPPLMVGGQAVLEGVMMRSPRALAIAVRLPDGSLLLQDEPYLALGERYPLLKKPFLRGPVVLLEALITGIRALTFSAQAALGEEEEQLGWAGLALTLTAAFALAFVVFGFLPHYLSGLAGYLWGRALSPADFTFHLIDGLLKALFLVAYIWGISFIRDIRRVFQYHGAEHKSICAYEAGQPLDLEHVRQHCTCHPRCGTTFILVVLLVSLVVFAVFFPLVPALTHKGLLQNLLQVLVKVGLMFPVAAVAYEIIRWGGNHPRHPVAAVLLWPGLVIQRLTALEPDDGMLEVALAALQAVLRREGVTHPAP